MAKVIVTKSKIDALNSAVSAKSGVTKTRTLDGMASDIAAIPSGGNTWSSDYLRISRVTVTVGANGVNTTIGVRDAILALAGVESNRLLGFSLRAKNSYAEGEIGRAIIYPNASIGYFSVLQYTGGAWGTGRMLEGYSATLPAGSVYDVYYWSVPS